MRDFAAQGVGLVFETLKKQDPQKLLEGMCQTTLHMVDIDPPLRTIAPQ
jgi:hypothetical protein